MALTKVSGGILDPGINVAGIVTATGFDGPFTGGSGSNIIAGIITATELDVNGNGDISGNLVVGGNLTANGDFTTLNTTLREVEILHVSAGSSATAGIITQTGTGDILNLYDDTTVVFSVADGGDTTFFGATSGRDILFDRSANTLQVKANAILKIGTGSYAADISTDGSNLNIDHNPISAIYLKTNDLQIVGTGTRGGVTYDGAIFRARTGVVELGHEVGNGGATGMSSDEFAKELEYFFLNPDADLPKPTTFRETMNPIEILNDMIDPRNYPYYADRLTKTGIRIGEFGLRILPAVGKLISDITTKPAFKIESKTGTGYVQDYDQMPKSRKIKGTGIFSEFLDNLVGTEMTEGISRATGLDDLIKMEEQKMMDRRTTVGP